MVSRTLRAGAISMMVVPLSGTVIGAQGRQAVIDSLMAAYTASGGPGAAVLVRHNGRVVYQKGFGQAHVENGIAVRAETNFRLASLSKQFTATAVMLLVRDEKVRYDDEIQSLLPALPAYARGVTVRHLLNHTSGLPDYEDFVPDSQSAQVHDADVPSLISQAPGSLFPPGSQYRYSNTGYALLALIVERIEGRPFAKVLAKRIFLPLGMQGTLAFEEGRSRVRHRAFGYTLSATGPLPTDQSNTSAVLGDGGIYSSVADLAKWDRALERNTLVSEAAQREAWTPPRLPDGRTSEYGFGWFVDRDHGTARLRHHGESRGFTNSILRYPARRLTVIILTNRTGGAPWDIAQRIAERFLAPSSGGASPAWRP